MDINQALAEARNYAWQIHTTTDAAEKAFLADRLAGTFAAIDQWIMRDGGTPYAWQQRES